MTTGHTQEQLLIEQQVESESKSVRTAYVLWLVFGIFGGHRIYLERVNTGVVMLMLALLGLLTWPIGVGAKFLSASVIWMLIDAALIPAMAAKQKNDVRQRVSAEAALSHHG